jgi:hypothetical protein
VGIRVITRKAAAANFSVATTKLERHRPLKKATVKRLSLLKELKRSFDYSGPLHAFGKNENGFAELSRSSLSKRTDRAAAPQDQESMR